MRKILGLTALHNVLTKVRNTPVSIGEGVGWYNRFMSVIQLLDAEDGLASDIIGVNKLGVRAPSSLKRAQK
jgi:hypothetical protein